MATFQYTGIDGSGKTLTGTVESDSPKSARLRIKKMGVVLLDISERQMKKGKGDVMQKVLGRKSVPFREVTLVTRQLASLIRANIPLVEALTALIDQTDHDNFKMILGDVRQQVNEGSSFKKALGRHPQVFTPIFINMVEAGEASGTLPLVLIRLADFLEKQMRLRAKIGSAMVYPLLMAVVGGALMMGIFTFVIPRIGRIFESMNKELPWYTQFFLNLSSFLVSFWWLLLAALAVGAWLLRTYVATPQGRARKDAFLLRLPIFGDIVRMIAVSRFASTMSTLLNGGVPIISALGIARAVVDNSVLSNAISEARENISEGQSIAGPLKKSGEFPVLIIHMIAIGERTGELPQMLEMVASMYEEQVGLRVDRLTTMLEPIMIVLMGVAVGIIVMAVFSPLLELQNLR